MYRLQDYQIHFVPPDNFPGKLVAFIEELHDVVAIVEREDEGLAALEGAFEGKIKKLRRDGQTILTPGQGAVKATFASNEKTENLRPFLDVFWSRVLKTPYASSFVSDESQFQSWEHVLVGGKIELVKNIKNEYGFDISQIYDKPIHEIVQEIRISILRRK